MVDAVRNSARLGYNTTGCSIGEHSSNKFKYLTERLGPLPDTNRLCNASLLKFLNDEPTSGFRPTSLGHETKSTKRTALVPYLRALYGHAAKIYNALSSSAQLLNRNPKIRQERPYQVLIPSLLSNKCPDNIRLRAE